VDDGRALERIRWRSRRGLLELDLVLDRFWKGAGRTLAYADLQAMERLLALPDNDLLDLVMGRTESADKELRDLIDRLRAA
jgi:succinate dehydrogenase flavin-adding protein (antitoxin of CptAB toxin-antitoxin module)